MLSRGISETSRGGPLLRRCTSLHCSGVRFKLRVSCLRRRALRFTPRRLCWRWASPKATRLRLRACPAVTEVPNMLWAITVKRPTVGSMLRAGKGCWGAREGGARSAGRVLRRYCRKRRARTLPVAWAQS